jgi:hypothetical protein
MPAKAGSRTARAERWLARFLAVALGGVAGLLLHLLAMADVSTSQALAQGRQASQIAKWSTDPNDPFPLLPELADLNLLTQTDAEQQAKSAGCVACHQNATDPHAKPGVPNTLRLGCTDCHGGDACAADKDRAHVAPRFPDVWRTSANPVRSYTVLNHESPDFIRFVNPGDFRVAHISCGTSGCHPREVETNRKSMMTHGCMLWGAALYNNGTVPFKRARFGESYSMNGAPLRVLTNPPPTKWEMERKGVVPFLDPLPRFEASQPGNLLRIFERGGRFRSEVGIPERLEESGRPRTRLSERGLGTENRTDPVLVSLNKTRLFDPTLNFLGTNDHPGDYRSSGCTGCHVVYANDRSPVHSGPYAKFGNRGTSFNPDPTIPKDESGHPIAHRFTSAIPTSQCIVCHIHPGTTVMNSYLGYMWWDEETEGRFMYPEQQKHPTMEQWVNAQIRNPDETALRGNWIDPDFLNDIVQLNPSMNKAHFADFHGHGWVFRAIFKQDKNGRLLDHQGAPVPAVTPQKLTEAIAFPERAKEFHRKEFDTAKQAAAEEEKLNCTRAGTPVHLLDIHLEKGMHCIDCHFSQDVHGNGRLQMEVRAAVEITCIDCHGTITEPAKLRTTGPAAYTSAADGRGRNLAALRTPFGKPRFEIEGERIFQNSMVEKGLRWEVVQVKDTITPGHPRYSAKSRLAKTVRFEGNEIVWGDVPAKGRCAHANDNMSCIACHSSWNQSCYGCHLPQRANIKLPHTHWDGDVTRNYVPYNFQTLRDEVYMLARDGNVTGNKIGPARSSCAIHVGSYNNNRESIYVQQQTLSAEGFSGIAFSTNVPHTVRGNGVGETKSCTDCHVSKAEDNNAWMSQLLMHGTGYLNFMGRYCWVACADHGLHAVEVTERSEPQAVIGSTLHALAYPDCYEKHQKHGQELEHAHEHPGLDIGERLLHPLREANILSAQPRGEYCFAACGEGGVRAFDIAFIDDKAFSERISTAPVSPKGQKFHVPTRYATWVAAPSLPAVDPTRARFPENHEGPIHPLYGYVYATDKYEGLILIGIATTVNGNPLDNFLKRELTFNPDGCLSGARFVQIVGNYAYVCCDAGLAVICLNNPTNPQITAIVGEPFLKGAKAVQAQFRYAYVVDEEGIKVLDVTDMARPRPVSMLRVDDCHSIYLARTYAYVAAGARGLMILDIIHPDRPRIDQIFDANGQINDLRDVKLGITYTSEFAYLADGKNGLRVVQLTSPETPGNGGFAPRPTPCLVATYKVPHGGCAISVCRGLDRDRAVDESGNQIGVFGRVGARPLNLAEQQKLFLRNGKVWRVSDDPADADYHERQYVPPKEKQRPSDDSGLFGEKP